jgi:hypothetical protein
MQYKSQKCRGVATPVRPRPDVSASFSSAGSNDFDEQRADPSTHARCRLRLEPIREDGERRTIRSLSGYPMMGFIVSGPPRPNLPLLLSSVTMARLHWAKSAREIRGLLA